MKKIYVAVVEGILQNSAGMLHHYLVKNSENNTVHVANAGTAGSQEAILRYQALGTADNKSLVQIELETGRPHQIRVQFSYSGNPLVGEEKYGRTDSKKPTKHLALWSCEVTFKHPVRDEIIRVESRPPKYYWICPEHIYILQGGYMMKRVQSKTAEKKNPHEETGQDETALARRRDERL